MQNSITLDGRIPSKKNNKIFVKRGPRTFLIPHPNYTAWHEEQSWMLKKYKGIRTTSKIKAEFWLPDNRKTDLSNKIESVMDLLVDNGIIEDDSWQIISDLHLIANGIDKENPRVVITFI